MRSRAIPPPERSFSRQPAGRRTAAVAAAAAAFQARAGVRLPAAAASGAGYPNVFRAAGRGGAAAGGGGLLRLGC